MLWPGERRIRHWTPAEAHLQAVTLGPHSWQRHWGSHPSWKTCVVPPSRHKLPGNITASAPSRNMLSGLAEGAGLFRWAYIVESEAFSVYFKAILTWGLYAEWSQFTVQISGGRHEVSRLRSAPMIKGVASWVRPWPSLRTWHGVHGVFFPRNTPTCVKETSSAAQK